MELIWNYTDIGTFIYIKRKTGIKSKSLNFKIENGNLKGTFRRKKTETGIILKYIEKKTIFVKICIISFDHF